MNQLRIKKIDSEDTYSGTYYYSNGYAKIDVRNNYLNRYTKQQLQRFTDDKLSIGVQWNTPLLIDANKKVTQVYCSALPIDYFYDLELEIAVIDLAKCILESAFKHTLQVGVNKLSVDKPRATVYLTAVGGGVFGNKIEWIYEALVNALYEYRFYPLDIKMVWFYNHAPLLNQENVMRGFEEKISTTSSASASASTSASTSTPVVSAKMSGGTFDSNIDYESKYLKYKEKYLRLKNKK